ncbi:MAG: ABC transporter permease [Fimbriimonadaceae bacterium]
MRKRPSQIAISFGLFKYTLRATLRNRNSLIFGLLFPLIFVAVFGSFGGGATRAKIGLSTKLAASPSPLIRALQAMNGKPNSPVDIVTLSDAQLEQQVSHGDVGAGIEAGADGGTFTVITSTANPIGGATANGILESIANGVNLKTAEVAAGPNFKAPVALNTKDVAGKEFRYIDFVLPGMIGFSLISTATFGVAFPFLSLRRTLVLKRMLATSAKPISFVVSQCLSRSVQAVGQAAVLIGVGVLGYHFVLPHGSVTFVEMLVVAFLGICSFMGFGILIANIAKDEQTAPLILNLFNLPQFLLAGVFFPSDTLPSWLQVIAKLLPLSFVNQAMRSVASDGKHLYNVLPQIGGMVAWSIIAYVAAAKTFRTD